MKKFDLIENPSQFPEAMASATRLGFQDGMVRKRKTTSIDTIASIVLSNYMQGHAAAIKQAYNAGYWSATVVGNE